MTGTSVKTASLGFGRIEWLVSRECFPGRVPRLGKIPLDAARRANGNGGLLGVHLAVVEEFFLGDREWAGEVVEFLVKTTLVPRVAGGGRLFDLEQKNVLVAVHKPPHDALGVTACLAFEPELFARAAPVGHFSGLEGQGKRFAAHPSKHENASSRNGGSGGFLHDDGDQPVRVKFKMGFHGIASLSNIR